MRQAKSKVGNQRKRTGRAKVESRTPEKDPHPQVMIKERKTATRAESKVRTAPQMGQRQASYVKEHKGSATPVFMPCALIGPDGKERAGWEMWVDGMVFGRADTQESLLAYYTRLHEPIPSGHWRERTWQPPRRKPAGHSVPNEQEDSDEENLDLAVVAEEGEDEGEVWVE